MRKAGLVSCVVLSLTLSASSYGGPSAAQPSTVLDVMENVFEPGKQSALRALVEIEMCTQLRARMLRRRGVNADLEQLHKQCSCSTDLALQGRSLPADQHEAALERCEQWSKSRAARRGRAKSPFRGRAGAWDSQQLMTVYQRCQASEPRTGLLRSDELRTQYCGCLVDAASYRGGSLTRPFRKIRSQDRTACRSYSQELMRRYEAVRAAAADARSR